MIDKSRLKITTQPVSEPVSLAEAKAQLRVDHDEEDALLESMIMAARIHCEHISRRAFVTRTYTLKMDYWPHWCFELLYPPLVSVTSIKYTDSAGVEATFSSGNYLVDTFSEPGRVALKNGASWPSVTLQDINGVEIIYTAGYGTAEDVPETYKLAIRAYLGTYYENREQFIVQQGLSSINLPFADHLLMTDRGGW